MDKYFDPELKHSFICLVEVIRVFWLLSQIKLGRTVMVNKRLGCLMAACRVLILGGFVTSPRCRQEQKLIRTSSSYTQIKPEILLV